MSNASHPLPASWRAHGVFRPPQGALGLLPQYGLHVCISAASPAVLGAVVADLACAVATSIVDSPLAVRPGLPRRSPAGFAGSRATVAPQSVAILSATPALDLGPAITAAALARGVARPLEIGWSRLEAGSLAATPDAGRRLHEIADHFDAPLGLIVVVDDFEGDRLGDAPLWRTLLGIATTVKAPVLVVTSRAPAEIDDDAVVMRIDDKALAIDNPATGAPFTVALEREDVELGAESATIVRCGPRRAYAPPVRAKTEPEAAAPIEEAPEKAGTMETIYLVQTGRQLEADEASVFGESKWTADYLSAVKWAGQSTADRAEVVVVPSNRDPRGEAAGAVMQRVKSQVLTAGLGAKVSVLVSSALRIAA